MKKTITVELELGADMHSSELRNNFVNAFLKDMETKVNNAIDEVLEDKPSFSSLLDKFLGALTFGSSKEPSVAQIVWVQEHAEMVSVMAQKTFTPEEIRRDVIYHAKALAEVKQLHNCGDKCCPVVVALHDFPLN